MGKQLLEVDGLIIDDKKSSDFSATAAEFPPMQIKGLQHRAGAKVRICACARKREKQKTDKANCPAVDISKQGCPHRSMLTSLDTCSAKNRRTTSCKH